MSLLAPNPAADVLPSASRRRVGPPARPVRRPQVDSPWLASDATRCGAICLVGLIGLSVCWYGISGEAVYQSQLPWLVGGVGATVVSGAGMVGWLLAGMREVHREMMDVLDVIRTENLHQVFDLTADEFGPSFSGQKAAAVKGLPSGYVTNASMTRVHRPECQHVQGRVVEQIDVAEIERRELTYCGVCCT